MVFFLWADGLGARREQKTTRFIPIKLLGFETNIDFRYSKIWLNYVIY